MRLIFVLLCFFISGVAALIYETAWTQQMAVVFGTSYLAVGAVLAAYMGGLAAGASLCRRYLSDVRSPLRWYAVLELIIALSALMVPYLVDVAGWIQIQIFSGSGLDSGSDGRSAGFFLLATFVILAVPTMAMGATLPLLARYAVAKDEEVSLRVGLLYGVNTAGAAMGVLSGTFFLAPQFGIGDTVLIAVGLNVLAAAIACELQRRSRPPIVEAVLRTPSAHHGPTWILWAMALSGSVALAYEILWTKLLGHLMGGTIYGFGTMLATFLTGLAVGGALGAPLIRNQKHAVLVFAFAQLSIAICFYLSYGWMDQLSGVKRGVDLGSLSALYRGLRLCGVTLFPGAVAMGLAFPAAVRIFTTSASHTGAATARIYSWNTTGAIVGAIGASFWMLPALQVAGTTTLLIAVSLLIAASVFGLYFKSNQRLLPAFAASGSIVAAGFFILTLASPQPPFSVLRQSPIGPPAKGEIVRHATGRSATVMLLERGGDLRLTTNGLPESAIQRAGSRAAKFTIAHWLSLLPVAARPSMDNMVIVGLGAGQTVTAVPASVARIDVIELEREVVRANLSQSNWRRVDPLADPRVTLHVNDARSALRLSNQRFGAIVSQPSHPWTAGSANLYTQDFFELARSRLTNDGVFVQWIGRQFVDQNLLQVLAATLNSVFDHVELYRPVPGGILFLASNQPFDWNNNAVLPGIELWREQGVASVEDLMIARQLNSDGLRQWVKGASLSTDQRNLMRTAAPRALASPLNKASLTELLSQSDSLEASVANGNLYPLRRLLSRGFTHRAEHLAQKIQDPVRRQAAQGILGSDNHSWAVSQLEAAASKGSTDALYALMQMRIAELLQAPANDPLLLQLQADTVAQLIYQSWMDRAEGKPERIRNRESALAQIGPAHPLHTAATRLRIQWRWRLGNSGELKTAVSLLDQLIAAAPTPRDLLTRAQLGRAGKDNPVAIASLFELASVAPILGSTNSKILIQAQNISMQLLTEQPAADPTLGLLRSKLTAGSQH